MAARDVGRSLKRFGCPRMTFRYRTCSLVRLSCVRLSIHLGYGGFRQGMDGHRMAEAPSSCLSLLVTIASRRSAMVTGVVGNRCQPAVLELQTPRHGKPLSGCWVTEHQAPPAAANRLAWQGSVLSRSTHQLHPFLPHIFSGAFRQVPLGCRWMIDAPASLLLDEIHRPSRGSGNV